MLRDGKFIRTTEIVKTVPYDTGKVRIGEFYTPSLNQRASTPEERLVQDIMLGQPILQRPNVITRIFGRLLAI